MKKTLLVAAIAVVTATAANAEVIAYWDFNNFSVTGTVASATPPAATIGSSIASLSFAGWTGGLASFAGTTNNAYESAPAGNSLSLVATPTGSGSSPYPGNGGYIQFTLNMTGYEDLALSFSTRGTATGFNSGIWSYSLNGSSFTTIGGNTASVATSFATVSVDLSGVSAINNASAVYLRYTLSGATSASGNNRIDNLQFTATTAVPEPHEYAVAVAGLLTVLVVARRRRATRLDA